ncbi:signal recognition particle-docking protein FtsY [Actinoalloteichus spitiensis]|uniref:signal recognition particle-docking protein FtsY n=1 Tax=Actinoalloteichus spitiensis TaxID=252394 RepID=UPI00068DEAE1|nr:signal recognition particle-docking protein FtsY [Actinoalloteichus spitiensis]
MGVQCEDGAVSTTLIWIIAVVAVVLVVALVTGLLLARRRRISLREEARRSEELDQGRRGARGGGYQAGGGVSLSSGSAAPPSTESPDRPATAPAPDQERPPSPPPTAEVTGEDVEHPVAERTETDGQPGVGDDASVPRDTARRDVVDVELPEDADQASTDTAPTTDVPPRRAPEPPTTTPPAVEPPSTPLPPAETSVTEPEEPAAPTEPIAPTTGRLERLRGRLSRSRSTLGQSLLGLLGAGDLDEDSWTDVEDTLLMADLGASATAEIVEKLRARIATSGARDADQVRRMLSEVLVEALQPGWERSVRALPHSGRPAVVLVVGVNGTGKTTTTGKLARVLVADGRQVLLGAADTFRAAAADQLATWAERVGSVVVRGREGADPASVAYDAVRQGVEREADAVLVDTAGRLHTKTGLMDELGKVKRVVEKQAEVDEVLLVLDATTGQNGLVQARVFSEVVDVTGIVLTKLDGTAKGGIVFQVQRELGVPVKLVGLGEGPDDLAPFEPGAFVRALLD